MPAWRLVWMENTSFQNDEYPEFPYEAKMIGDSFPCGREIFDMFSE